MCVLYFFSASDESLQLYPRFHRRSQTDNITLNPRGDFNPVLEVLRCCSPGAGLYAVFIIRNKALVVGRIMLRFKH